MSRIGYQPIKLSEGVKATIADHTVNLVGPKGELTVSVPNGVTVESVEGELRVKRVNDETINKALHGTVRALLNNAQIGVTEGWEKQLVIHGSGYKFTLEGDTVEIGAGFSHPVKIKLPAGIEAKSVKNSLHLSGIDKQVVGEIAAQIRAVKKPEPYKGKGIRYHHEHIIRKEGKALKASA